MTERALRGRRVLTITGLLIAATGITAAPIRNVWLPLVARPLGWWSVGGTRVPDLSARPAAAPGRIADVDAPLTRAPERADFIAAPILPLTANRTQNSSQRVSGSETRGSSNGSIRQNRGGGRARFDLADRVRGSRDAGGAGSAVRRRGEESNRRSNNDNRALSSSSGSSRGGSSGSGGSASSGGTASSAGSASNPGGLFEEHTAGLPELSGAIVEGAPLVPGAAVRGGDNVAVHPEPSTLLLLGTGLVGAAGALRRRLR